ncbi:MAG: RNA polymerase sigma factor [Planctomyces sp.]|nr:RNA polymerase sigma factor [Planctomyces sp.]
MAESRGNAQKRQWIPENNGIVIVFVVFLLRIWNPLSLNNGHNFTRGIQQMSEGDAKQEPTALVLASPLDQIQAEISAIMAFAVRLTGNVHDAEDLAQECILKAVRSVNTFRGDSSVRTWLFRILLNAFKTSQTRQPKRTVELSVEEPVDTRSTVSEGQLSKDEIRTHIAAIVSELPPRQREVIVLVHYEGYSATAAADLLETTIQNVYSTLNVARGTLKQKLKHYEGVFSHES